MSYNCIYRVSETAEPREGYFRLDRGGILNETLCEGKERIPVLEAYPWHYENREDYILPKHFMYDMLYKYQGVNLVINYFNIGVIIVDSENMNMCLYEGGLQARCVPLGVKPFFSEIKTQEVGVVKAPVFTYSAFQPLTRLVVFEEEGEIRSVTRFGKVKLASNIDVKDLAYDNKFKHLLTEQDVNKDIVVYAHTLYKGEPRTLLLNKVSKKISLDERRVTYDN